MALNKGLGRGLASLIPDKKNTADKISQQAKQAWGVNATRAVSEQNSQTDSLAVIEFLSIDKIDVNPYQPRQSFSHSGLEELMASIKEHGILQPLIVAPQGDKYQLIAGERRLRAARFLELDKVPAIIRPVSEQEQLELSLIENIQRQDLNPLEEAQAYQRLITEFNLTQEEVGQRVGKSRSKVANILRLLQLPVEVQVWLSEGKLTESHAKILLELDKPHKQITLAKRIMRQKLTVRDSEQALKHFKEIKVKGHSRQLSESKYGIWEKNLQSVLGTKVRIEDRNGRGQVVLEYFSEEELRSLVERINQLDDML